MTVQELPIHYFLTTAEFIRKELRPDPDTIVMVKLDGILNGYLCMNDDATMVSSFLHLPCYRQKVLNHKGEIPYTFIPSEQFDPALSELDESGHGIILADRDPNKGFSWLTIQPIVQQICLF